jgi:hypothetical protein
MIKAKKDAAPVLHVRISTAAANTKRGTSPPKGANAMRSILCFAVLAHLAVSSSPAFALDWFTGTVTGTAAVTITSTRTFTLKIVGMKVKLMRKDFLADTEIAKTVTTEGGLFELPFAEQDGAASWDLYVKFVAENEEASVRVRKRFVGTKETREEDYKKSDPIRVPANQHTEKDLGTVFLDAGETKPQLFHWANRARQFVEAELGADVFPSGNAGTIDILQMPTGFGGGTSFFFPGGYQSLLILWLTELNTVLGSTPVLELLPGIAQLIGPLVGIELAIVIYVNTQFSDRDAMYIGDNAQYDENTVFHEFGHFLMWHLQNESWANPIEASFSTHGFSYNAANSKIAWTEGFANGFAMIVDTWSQADDGEMFFYGTSNYEDRAAFAPELRTWCMTTGGCGVQGLTHGYVSEWYVGTAMYDLWDGPDRLPPASPSTSWDDSAAMLGIDDLQLSFSRLMQPLLNNQGTGGFHCPSTDVICTAVAPIGSDPDQESFLILDAVEYHAALVDLDSFNDSAITDIFHRNGILNLVPDSQLTPPTRDWLNTDKLSFVRTILTPAFVSTSPDLLESKGVNLQTFTVSISELSSPNDDFGFGGDTAGETTGVLSDDLVVGGAAVLGGSTFFLNGTTFFGFQNAGNSYSQPLGVRPLLEPTFEVTVTEGTVIDAHDGGTIRLGDVTQGRTAELIFEAGSTLVLGGGRTGNFLERERIPDGAFMALGPMVSKGKLILERHSRVVIERGATLVIDQGAEISLGQNTELVIRGELDIRPDATLWYNSWQGGRIIFDLPDRDGEPNFTMASSGRIVLNEVTFEIASYSYVRPTDIFGPEIIIEHNATGQFGAEAYLDVGRARFELDESTIEASEGVPHAGLLLRGGTHSIALSTISGGAPCIHDHMEAGAASLVMDEMTFTGCETSIEVIDLSVVLTDSSVSSCSVGIDVDSGSATVANSDISSCGIGIAAVMSAGGVSVSDGSITGSIDAGVDAVGHVNAPLSGVMLRNVTLAGNGVGARAHANTRLRAESSRITHNGSGFRLSSGAILDISNNAANEFHYNAKSVELYFSDVPRLNNGGNAFYPQQDTPQVDGLMISGTTGESALPTCAGANRNLAASTNTWNHSFNAVFGWMVSTMNLGPYDFKDSSGCPYTLVP